MGINIKDFFLNNLLPQKEYMKIALKVLPRAIIKLYNLEAIAKDGYVLVEIGKGMYGLPQATRVANKALIPRLAAAGYHQSDKVPGLFLHETNSFKFCLTVDDFGVRYVEKKDAQHLVDTLQEHYNITTDWEGATYCGLDLYWNYSTTFEEQYVNISMDGYVAKALQRFGI